MNTDYFLIIEKRKTHNESMPQSQRLSLRTMAFL